MKVFVVDSEGNLVGNAHYYRRSYGTLRGAQRRTCRRKKGSKHGRKAARAVTQEVPEDHPPAQGFPAQERMAVVLRLTDHRGRRPKHSAGMVKNGPFAKSVADASWSNFVAILEQRLRALVLESSVSQRTSSCSNGVSATSWYLSPSRSGRIPVPTAGIQKTRT